MIPASNHITDDEKLEKARLLTARALQQPLTLLATKEYFRAEAHSIAEIAENANPEDPRMLGVEVEAHKVRPVRRRGLDAHADVDTVLS
jgi:hypothetical protein